MTDNPSWSTTPPLTRRRQIEAYIVETNLEDDSGAVEEQALSEAVRLGVNCPAPIAGYYLHHTYWDSEGECWCVYVRIDPPLAWYEQPCL